jgi:hypothetical protein
MPLDPALLRPAQHCHASELGAVIGNAHDRTAAHGNEEIELTHDAQARQQRVGDQCQAFAREVIDNCQNPEAMMAPDGGSSRILATRWS